MRKPLIMGLSLLSCLLFIGQAQAQGNPNYHQAIYAVVIEGKPTTDAMLMEVNKNAVFLTMEQWESLGIKPKNEKQKLVSSKDLNIKVKFNDNDMTVALTLPPELMPETTIGSNRRQLPKQSQIGKSPKGLFLNYDLAFYDKNHYSLGNQYKFNIAGGVFNATTQTNFNDGDIALTRGLTTYQRDFLDKKLTLQIGDLIPPSNNGSINSVNLGGIRLGSDRQLSQWGGFYSAPVIGGLADTRSTAEIMVNNQKRLQQEIPKGSFQFQHYSINPGLNNIQLITTDAYGRQHIVNDSVYLTRDNLTKGLNLWNVSLGKMRQGRQGDQYGDMALQADWTKGFTNKWTFGGSTQTSQGAFNLGFTNRFILGSFGSLVIDNGFSHSSQGQGYSYDIGFSRATPTWTFNVDFKRQHNFWQLSNTGPSSFNLSRSLRVATSYHPRDLPFSLSAQYFDTTYNNNRNSKSLRIGAMIRPTKNTNMSIYAGSNFQGKPEYGLYFNMRLGSAIDAISYSHHNKSDQIGLSGRFNVKDTSNSYQASFSQNQQYGSLNTRWKKVDTNIRLWKGYGQTETTGRARGGLWLGQGGVIPTKYSYGSYAVVEVPKTKGVQVMGNSGRQKTNKKGVAVISNIPGLYPQRIAIDSTTLPITTITKSTKTTTYAPRGGGVAVKFPVDTYSIQAFKVKGIQDTGTATTDTEEVIIGEDGLFYLQHPKIGETIHIRTQDKQCDTKITQLKNDTETLQCIK